MILSASSRPCPSRPDAIRVESDAAHRIIGNRDTPPLRGDAEGRDHSGPCLPRAGSKPGVPAAGRCRRVPLVYGLGNRADDRASLRPKQTRIERRRADVRWSRSIASALTH